AEVCGVDQKDSFILNNGEVLALSKDKTAIAGKVPSGSIYVDGSGIGDIGNIVVRDGGILSEEGYAMDVESINMKELKIAAGPHIISRGFVYKKESEDLIKEAKKAVALNLNKMMKQKTSKWSVIKNEIIDTIAPLLYEKTKRRPMVLPIIMEI